MVTKSNSSLCFYGKLWFLGTFFFNKRTNSSSSIVSSSKVTRSSPLAIANDDLSQGILEVVSFLKTGGKLPSQCCLACLGE